MPNSFYKENETDVIYWVHSDHIGEFLFSFDQKKIYNLFQDYPWKLAPDELEIFNKENPYWAEFFIDRLIELSPE